MRRKVGKVELNEIFIRELGVGMMGCDGIKDGFSLCSFPLNVINVLANNKILLLFKSFHPIEMYLIL